MAFAMRINFVDVVCDNSLKNTYVGDKVMGYQFDIRLSYYRGHFLSVIDELEVTVDGLKVPTECVTFCLKDKEYGVAQLHDIVDVFWPIIEPATIKVHAPGGLRAGEHEVDVKLMFHSPYMPISDTEYMPIDGCGSKVLTIQE